MTPPRTSLVVISGSQHLIVFVFITLCNLIFNLMQVQIKVVKKKLKKEPRWCDTE